VRNARTQTTNAGGVRSAAAKSGRSVSCRKSRHVDLVPARVSIVASACSYFRRSKSCAGGSGCISQAMGEEGAGWIGASQTKSCGLIRHSATPKRESVQDGLAVGGAAAATGVVFSSAQIAPTVRRARRRAARPFGPDVPAIPAEPHPGASAATGVAAAAPSSKPSDPLPLAQHATCPPAGRDNRGRRNDVVA
jgi:hypothetical protein